jgi:hypothetical protein
VTLVGSLAVAAITASARSLIHDLDATVMILVWNLGVAALIAALGSMFGAGMFRWWRAVPSNTRRDDAKSHCGPGRPLV